MKRYLIKRLLMIIPMLLIITFISYMIMDLAPGDPSLMYIDFEKKNVTREYIEEMREKMGLNRPFYVRYFLWLKQVFQGNLGYSLVSQRSVAWEIGQRLNVTLLMVLIATVLQAFIGIALGIIGALNHGKLWDSFIQVICYITMSIPYSWLCLLMITLFTLKLGWLPSTGMHDLMLINPTRAEYIADTVKHMIMPILCMVIPGVGSWARFQRGAFLDAMNQDFVRTARAKGLSERRITWKHVLKNASIPTITSIAASLPNVITGSTMIESVFGISGLGSALTSAASSRDYPMEMASLLIVGLLTLLGVLLSDILYAIVDPRIRYN